jgi:FlaG/FlaF family flagellin (archaellin)
MRFSNLVQAISPIVGQTIMGAVVILFANQAYSQSVVGNWKLTSAQCAGGQDITVGNTGIQFADESAFQTLEEVEQIAGCAINVSGKYGISTNQITLQPIQASSSPTCGFTPQVPQTAVDSFVVNGNRLTLQFTTPDDNGPCAKGIVQTSIFIKQ